MRPLSSLASFRIRLRSTSTSAGPNRASNASTCTFTLGLRSKYSYVLAMIVLSLVFRPLPSSSYLSCSLSKEVYEFCMGASGVILLLESGGAYTSEPSYLISSCVSVPQCASFLEKEKDCGFPIRATGKNTTQLSNHRRRGNKHTNHIKHHTHMRTRITLTIRQVLRLVQGIPPRQPTITLQIFPLH